MPRAFQAVKRQRFNSGSLLFAECVWALASRTRVMARSRRMATCRQTNYAASASIWNQTSTRWQADGLSEISNDEEEDHFASSRCESKA